MISFVPLLRTIIVVKISKAGKKVKMKTQLVDSNVPQRKGWNAPKEKTGVYVLQLLVAPNAKQVSMEKLQISVTLHCTRSALTPVDRCDKLPREWGQVMGMKTHFTIVNFLLNVQQKFLFHIWEQIETPIVFKTTYVCMQKITKNLFSGLS